ncbi:MAG: plasmid stabilization system [Hyphomicrobiales bacterium]|nr:plasmid stabilization system [Hyphomicrobiales bacterium]
MRIRITRRAKADVQAIVRLIRSYDRIAATRFIARLDDGFRTLAEHPFSGEERTEFGPGVRRKVIGLTLVFDRADPQQLVILRALDGRMDVETEFLK